MDDRKKLGMLAVVIVLAVGVLAYFVGTGGGGPKETVTEYKRVPPKGAGKLDRD